MPVQSLGQEDSPGERYGNHSSILAWRIPWIEEPDGLQSMVSQRVGYDWSDLAWYSRFLGAAHSFLGVEEMSHVGTFHSPYFSLLHISQSSGVRPTWSWTGALPMINRVISGKVTQATWALVSWKLDPSAYTLMNLPCLPCNIKLIHPLPPVGFNWVPSLQRIAVRVTVTVSGTQPLA